MDQCNTRTSVKVAINPKTVALAGTNGGTRKKLLGRKEKTNKMSYLLKKFS
jgi:hypothetical protein